MIHQIIIHSEMVDHNLMKYRFEGDGWVGWKEMQFFSFHYLHGDRLIRKNVENERHEKLFSSGRVPTYI